MSPVRGKTVPEGVGKDDLIPVIKRVPLEFHVPGLVYRFDGFVSVLQPDAEGVLTDAAVAFVAELIVDMPAGNVGIARVPHGQPFRQGGREMPVNRGIGAGVVPSAEFMLSSLIIRVHDLRIPLYHPGGKRRSGGGHDDVVVFL